MGISTSPDISGIIDRGNTKVQRALRFLHGPGWHAVGVDHGRADIGAAEQRLDRADVVVRLQQVDRERVAKGVRGDAFRDLRFPNSKFQRLREIRLVEMIPPQLALSSTMVNDCWGKNQCQTKSFAAEG